MKRLVGIIVAAAIIIIVIVIAMSNSSNKSTPTNSSSSNNSSSASVPDVNNAVLITKTSSSLGKYLAEPNGTPLYTYGGDSNGVSNCTGSCISTWPAYEDKGSTTGLPSGVGTIKRADDGQTQFTYNGMPLYTFVSDTNGNPTGNGVSNFSLAKPARTSSSSSSSGNSSTNSAPSNSNNQNYNY